MPLLPKPPEPVDSVDFLGMKNGVLKLFFWSVFAFSVWEFCRWKTGPTTPRAVIEVAAMGSIFAMHCAVWFNRFICALVSDARQNQYELNVEALKQAQPVEAQERDAEGRWQDRRRPLYDERMGVER